MMIESDIESDRAFPDAELGVTPRSTELRKHMIDTNVSWKVGATEGDKKGKKWFTDKAGNNEVQDHQWMELWDGIQSMNTAERLKFLSEHYEITYQTLQRKVGKAPEPTGRKMSRTTGTGRPQAATGRSKVDVEAGLEERIDALKEELEKSEARLARLKEMDDAEYQEMRLLLLG